MEPNTNLLPFDQVPHPSSTIITSTHNKVESTINKEIVVLPLTQVSQPSSTTVTSTAKTELILQMTSWSNHK